MSDKLNIGKLIAMTDLPPRDAIHVAVAPVIANERLSPGDHIGFTETGRVGRVWKPIGIVDPFLSEKVMTGEKFWMFLYPGSITALRHEWTHPSFDITGVKLAGVSPDLKLSEQWLHDYADELDITYQELMEGAKDWQQTGEYFTFHGRSTPEVAHTKIQEFWKHHEAVTGTKPTNIESFFTCTC